MMMYGKDELEYIIGAYSERISTVLKPDDHDRLLALAQHNFDQAVLSLPTSIRKQIACKKTCSHCCHLVVTTNAHEIISIVKFIRKNKSSSEISAIIQKANRNAKTIDSLGFPEWRFANIQCPLLNSKGECSCYPVRPTTCRSFHSLDRTKCKIVYENPRTDIPVPILEDYQIASAIYLASLNMAYEQFGYDPEIYFLNHALAEGLSNKQIANRWQNKKATFSKHCISNEHRA